MLNKSNKQNNPNRSVLLRLIALCSIAIILIAAFIPSTLLPQSVVHAQDKSLVWERFDVDITVNTDGTIDVVEHQLIRFTSGTFTKGSRDIPREKFGQLDNWSLIDSNGEVYDLSTTGLPFTFSVQERGTEYRIAWYFPEIANAAEGYSIGYTVHDAMRFYEAGDQLWWKAIFGDRPFPVLDGVVTVRVPQQATIHQWAAYVNEANAKNLGILAEVRDDGHEIVYTLSNRLRAGEALEVRVEFTPGVVDGSVQSWQRSADAEAEARAEREAYLARWQPIAALVFGALGVLFLLGGPASLYGLWYMLGRDKPVEMVADYIPEAPDDLPPGMVGTLLDESVDMQDILATLVDLAQRKAISITQDSRAEWFTTSTDFIYKLERDDVPMRAYEKYLLRALFGNRSEVRLSDIKNTFYEKLPAIKEEIYEAVKAEGFFPRPPNRVRNQYSVLAVVALMASVGMGVVLIGAFGGLTSAAVFPAIGMGLTSFGLMFLARHMPRKTDMGAESAARWEAFRNYLNNIEKYSDLDTQKEIWDRWLPYAVAFGSDKAYIRKFEDVQAPAPGWYIPSPNVYGPYRRRYYGTGPIGRGTMPGGPSNTPMPDLGGGEKGRGGGLGGGLGDLSEGLGGGLAGMSAGFGSMLDSASSAMTSRPVETPSGDGWNSGGGGFGGSGGGWSGGGGFSGGGSFGGGGGGGGGGFS